MCFGYEIANFFEDINFEIWVTNPDGCITTRNLFISVDKPIEFYVANTFNPNDPDESSLYLQCNEDLDIRYDLFIYDRWGNSIFSERDLNANEKGWGGQGYGIGTYVYMIILQGSFEDKVISGTINLLR